MDNKWLLDRKTIKTLSGDTRLDILKSLTYRRKTITELSKEFNMAPATIHEHMEKLEDAGLVIREETGHKWVYFNLTGKATTLIKPGVSIPVQIMLSVVGILMFGFGVLRYATGMPRMLQAPEAVPTAVGAIDKAVNVFPQQIDYLSLGMIIIGLVIVLLVLIINRK